MPSSRTIFKTEIKKYLTDIFEKNKNWKILDVGPGEGTYAKLLPEIKIDALEVFERYINDYNLNELYNKVHVGSIVDFDISSYDFYILGDILEHLTPEDGVKLIEDIDRLNKKCVVAVPFLAPQGEWGGNIYETHKQSDLTLSVMGSRYPSLKLLYTDAKSSNSRGYAYYTNI